MKYLLVLVVVLVAFYLWRSARAADAKPPPAAPKPQATPPGQLEMVRCAVCGLHLPDSDAVRSRRAVYCSVEHRQQGES